MDYLIPEEMRIHYRMQIARLAHDVSAADVVVVAEPIAPPLVAPILQAAAKHLMGRPVVLQAEIGDPLWTRYLREVNYPTAKAGGLSLTQQPKVLSGRLAD